MSADLPFLGRRFSVSHFWERIVRDKVNVVSVVPTLLQFLLEFGMREQKAGNTILEEILAAAT